jgi:MscS family membrane protein
MGELVELLQKPFLGISLGRYATAMAVVVIAYIVKKLFAQVYTGIILPLAARTKGELDDRFLECARKPAEALVFVIGLFVAVTVLQLPGEPYNIHAVAFTLLKVVVIVIGAWFLFNLTAIVDHYLSQWAARTESTLDDQLAPLLRKSLRIFVVVMAVLMAVQSFGYPITGLLASLGIGGLAFALAAKDTVSNIFGSLMIIFDRPFKVGDTIRAGDIEGTVEELGFRSTKVRTFSKTLISVPNNIIANTAVDNISRMPVRRINMTIGVTYASRREQICDAVARIKAMLQEHPGIDPEVIRVNFTDFGASALDIQITCFTTTVDFAEHLRIREQVCLQIMAIIEELGLEFAFPSRTVFLHHADPGGPLPQSATAGHS